MMKTVNIATMLTHQQIHARSAIQIMFSSLSRIKLALFVRSVLLTMETFAKSAIQTATAVLERQMSAMSVLATK